MERMRSSAWWRDTTYTSVYWKNHAMYFLPLTQRPVNAKDPDHDRHVSLRRRHWSSRPAAPCPALRSSSARPWPASIPTSPSSSSRPSGSRLTIASSDERLIARLTSLFGRLALLLAAIGLYGVTAYTVVRRTPEIGIRMALGAARSRVIGMVMRGAMLQAVTGLAIGIPVAIFCVRYVKSQLYEITSVDMRVMVGSPLSCLTLRLP